MIIENTNINKLIEMVISGKVNYTELKEFVHICKSLATAYLHTQQYYGHLYFRLSSENKKELEDLAIDSIAPLFARNDEGCFYRLRRYFEPIMDEINEDGTIGLNYLRRLVVASTRQELITFFRFEDPSGWRIFRNLQVVPKRNNRIGTFEDFNRIYYYHKPSVKGLLVPDELNPACPEVSDNILQGWFCDFLQDTQKTPVVVENVLKQLSRNIKYRWFISRSKIFRCLKATQGLQIQSMQEVEFDSIILKGSMDQFIDSYDRIINDVTTYLNESVAQIYLSTGKINSEELTVYVSVLSEYFSDLISSGQPKRLPKYMDHQLRKAAIKDQWTIHKTRLEYLIKLGKQNLGKKFDEKDFRV